MSTKPHYLGHRQRLKDRFMRDAGASLPDYEMLELGVRRRNLLVRAVFSIT